MFGSFRYFPYLCQQKTINNSNNIKKERVYIMNEYEFDFYGLTDEQEQIAKDIYENNKCFSGSYTLEEVDNETAEIWRDDTDDEEYRTFLTEALEAGAEIYSLTDHLGDFSQPIGEVAVY